MRGYPGHLLFMELNDVRGSAATCVYMHSAAQDGSRATGLSGPDTEAASGRTEMKWHMHLCIGWLFTQDLTWDLKLFRWILQMGYFSIFHPAAWPWGISTKKYLVEMVFLSIWNLSSSDLAVQLCWIILSGCFHVLFPSAASQNCLKFSRNQKV